MLYSDLILTKTPFLRMFNRNDEGIAKEGLAISMPPNTEVTCGIIRPIISGSIRLRLTFSTAYKNDITVKIYKNDDITAVFSETKTITTAGNTSYANTATINLDALNKYTITMSSTGNTTAVLTEIFIGFELENVLEKYINLSTD